MKSKTLIGKQIKRKTNPELVRTIISAKKNNNWKKTAEILSGPRKNREDMNLDEINEEAKEGEKILVIGKVLSRGEMDKKIKVVALDFSEKAKEKLLKKGCKVLKILEEIKNNPEAKEIRILSGKKK